MRSNRMHRAASLGRQAAIVLLTAAAPAVAMAQPGSSQPVAPVAHLSIAEAVQLALEHNHQLRAQRLTVEMSKADEITAALKPNPVLTSTFSNFPIFPPTQLTLDSIANNEALVASL